MTKKIYASVSQMETFDNQEGDGCPRKWWSKKVLKLPEATTKAQGFGSALHAVCERFLLADDLGRNPDGSAADIYPEGWETVKEYSGESVTLTPQEQQTVKILVDKLQSEGFLVRWENREVEYRFGFGWEGQEDVVILDDYRGYTVCFMGLIDVLLPNEVLDWKSTGNMKYAKSANKLRESLQMLGYAKVLLMKAAAEGRAVPSEVRLTHVVACKTPTAKGELKVRRTPVMVSAEEIEAGWRRIQKITKSMVDVLVAFDQENDWFGVPGPKENSRACNAYGGCPRQLVCAGQQTVATHRRTFELLTKTAETQAVPPPYPSQQKTMGLLANRAAAAAVNPILVPQVSAPIPPAAVASPFAAPTVAPVLPPPVAAPAPLPVPVAVAPVVAAPAIVVGLPPWAMVGCTSCGASAHLGFNSEGNPCRICDSKSANSRQVTSGMYTLVRDTDSIAWTALPDYVPQLAAVGIATAGHSRFAPPAEGVVVQDKVEQPVAVAPVAPAPAPVAMAPAVAAPAVQEAPAPVAVAPEPSPGEVIPIGAAVQPKPILATEELVMPKAARGRPTGFTLYIGCAPTTTRSSTVPLEGVFQRMASELAVQSGVASYFELHPFGRRDALASQAEQVAIFLAKKKITVVIEDPDLAAFVAALRPFASEIIEAVVSPNFK
jgi:hypothetical protein